MNNFNNLRTQYIHDKRKSLPLIQVAPNLLTIVAVWAYENKKPFITPEQQGIAITNYCNYAKYLN